MEYLDKNGNAHNSATGMRLADIRSTNIVEAVKEVTDMICDKFDGLIHKHPKEEGTITNIWYNINLRQWQFEEAGNPSIVIKTEDEMTPEFTQAIYNRADDSLRRGENLLVNLMFSIANEELPDLAERSHYANIALSATDVHPLNSLIRSHASLGLRIVGEIHPSEFGVIPDGRCIGQILTESIVALQIAGSDIRRET